jgi:hypothetical protein
VTLRLGSTGDEVAELHQRLLELGHTLSDEEVERAAFGPSTLVAVQSFQLAQRIRDDGVVGPVTSSRLVSPLTQAGIWTAPGWRYEATLAGAYEPAVRAAVGDLGLAEDPTGTNDGPQLAKYRTGGRAWCAYALSWWMDRIDGGCPWGRLGSAYKIREWGQTKRRVLPASEPLRPGDVWLTVRRVIVAGQPAWRGHVALIVSGEWEGMVSCVGGNEAGRVRGSLRATADATCIVRALG